MNEERIEIDSFDYFYRFTRMVAFCNMELAIDPETRDLKDELVEQYIEDSSDLIHTDELDELMSLVEVSEIVDPFIKKDPLSQIFYVEDQDTSEFTSKISYEMVLRLYKNLEDMGYVELCWDAENDDFVYRPKAPPESS